MTDEIDHADEPIPVAPDVEDMLSVCQIDVAAKRFSAAEWGRPPVTGVAFRLRPR